MHVKNLSQFEEQNPQVPGWKFKANSLYRKFEFESFSKAWGFVTKVIEFAKEMDHHPKLLSDYTKVEIWLTSHDEGGVSQRDVQLAEEINKIRI